MNYEGSIIWNKRALICLRRKRVRVRIFVKQCHLTLWRIMMVSVLFVSMRIIVLLFISFSVYAKDYGNVTVTEVTSIYDADTFRVNIEGYPPIVGERISIRLLGIDAPEIKGKCESEKIKAREAKQYTVQALRSAKSIELRNVQRGKYFRILANVIIDGQSLGEGLIKAGHARTYNIGKRMGWCSE